MAKVHYIAQEAVLVAIDISKKRNDVLIQIPGSTRRRRLTVLNQRAEHDRFIDQLKSFERPVLAGFEATGNYHRALAWRLVDAGIETRLISSMALARQREAIHNGWDKNDPKDAQVILHMLATGVSQTYQDPLAAGLADIQELSKTHEAVSRAKTQTIHRILTHYLPLYFPEIERFLNSSRRDWFFALLEKFPMPASITALSPEDFSMAVWDIVGKKTSKARLINDIYETAKESIGLPIPIDSKAIAMFRMVLAEARSLNRQRDAIEAEAEALLGGTRDYEALKQIPGIGPIISLTILAEAGDLRRFGHHRQFLKFCGLDLSTHQSGTFRGQTKLSKFGNARLRKALWMAGQVAIRQKENSFRDKYTRYIAKDRDNADLKRKALSAVTAKMARTAHAVIKSGKAYRPFYEGPVPGGRTSL